MHRLENRIEDGEIAESGGVIPGESESPRPWRFDFLSRLKIEWPIALVLFLCVITRLIPAVTRQDMIWPDEHFQTVEPAYKIVHGFWYKTWEWNDGFRSWIPALLFVPVIFVGKLFGVTGGMGLVSATRAQTALLSVLVPFGMDRIGVISGWSLVSRVAMLIAFLASPAMAMWAPATLTDTIGTALIWGFFPLAWEALGKGRGVRAGVLVSLPFLFRPHLAVFAFTFGLLTAIFPRTRGQTLRVLVGGVLTLSILAVVDWITWGSPLRSLIQQVTQGVKISEIYGVSPWYSYFGRFVEDQGWPWTWTALGSVALASAVAIFRRARPRFDGPFFWMGLSCVAFFAVHCALKHKENRFIQPIFPFFFLTFGLAVEEIVRLVSERWPTVRARLVGMRWGALSAWTPVMALAALVAAVYVGNESLTKPVYLSSVDVSPLLHRIYLIEKSEGVPEKKCILLAGHNWSWTRGAMGFGREYAGEDRRFEDLTPEDIGRCGWIIASPGAEGRIRGLTRAMGRPLYQVEKAKNGYVLFR